MNEAAAVMSPLCEGATMPEGCDREIVDPRIQEELESLNFASEEINKLERELDLSRNAFRRLQNDSVSVLESMQKSIGKSVNKARPYYDLLKQAKQSQSDAQHAALRYQRSISDHRYAKQMVARSEEMMKPSCGSATHDLAASGGSECGAGAGEDEEGVARKGDYAWLEVMNQATMKLLEAEQAKQKSEAIHQRKSDQYAGIQRKLRELEKQLDKHVAKAKPFFELKEKREVQLNQEKLNVEDLVRALHSAKDRYRQSLAQLEIISDSIHRQRSATQSLSSEQDEPVASMQCNAGSTSSDNLSTLTQRGSISATSSISDEIVSQQLCVQADVHHTGSVGADDQNADSASFVDVPLDDDTAEVSDTKPHGDKNTDADKKDRRKSLSDAVSKVLSTVANISISDTHHKRTGSNNSNADTSSDASEGKGTTTPDVIKDLPVDA